MDIDKQLTERHLPRLYKLLLVPGLLVIIATSVMYAGGGGLWTWIGAIFFLIALQAIVWISIATIYRRSDEDP